MGCGTALSSIFLAKGFGVEVWATDLWVKPDENLRLQWNEACDHDTGTPGREEAQMLRTDNGQTLGLSRVIARRKDPAAVRSMG